MKNNKLKKKENNTYTYICDKVVLITNQWEHFMEK